MNLMRVPSSTTIFFGKMPPGVMMNVASGNSGVPSALVPAAQTTPREFEYIARSTTSSSGVAPCASTSTENLLPSDSSNSLPHVDVEAAVGRRRGTSSAR